MTACCPQFLVHPDPDQLIRQVFDDLDRYQASWPDDRAFVLVPEYLKADLERRFMTDRQTGGLLMAEVLSFRRFAARLLGEAGLAARETISLAGKTLLAQKALLDSQQPFRKFHKLAGKPHYAAELVQVLGDFNRYQISSGDLRDEKTQDPLTARQSTLDKLHDFALLKDAVDQEIRELGLEDPDQDLARLAALLETLPLPARLHFLKRSHIWLVGFGNNRDFTAQEKQVLSALASQAASLTLAVAARPGGTEPAFQQGRDTLAGLTRLFPRASRPRPAAWEAAPEIQYRFIRSADRQEEARFTAGEIRRLLLTGDLRRKDIGIALCENEITPVYLEAALAEFGIDAYIESGKPFSNSSLIRFFKAFLGLCDYDFSLDDLLHYHRSGLSGLAGQTVDYFENAALALGWRTADDLRRLVRSQETQREALENLGPAHSHRDEALLLFFQDLEKVMELTGAIRKAASGQAKCGLLLDFLFQGEEAPQKLVQARSQQLMGLLRRQDAQLLVASWNALADFLDESGRLLGSVRLSQAQFNRMILAGMEGLSLPSIPSGIDVVRASSPARMSAWPCKVLFILGATEAGFPPIIRNEGFLLDEERIYLSRRTGKAFPNRKEDQAASQAWLVHSLLTRPQQVLYLSTPTLGGDTSALYDALLTEKDGTEVLLTQADARVDPRWYAPGAALRMMRLLALAPREWQAAVNKMEKEVVVHDLPAHTKAESLELPQSLVGSLLADRQSIHTSMLQVYNSCPFRFFTQYLAGASERMTADDRPNFQGTLIHRLMELAVKDLMLTFQEENPGQIQETLLAWERRLNPDYMQALYGQATQDRRLAWYSRPGLRGGVGQRIMARAADTLAAIAEFSQEEAYRPHLVEWYFPHQDLAPYRLQAAGQSFICRGVIDRLDINPQGILRLIDYKRSARTFSWTGLYDGTDLQLPLYKRAYEAAFPDRKVSSLLFAGWKTTNEHDFTAFRLPEQALTRDGVRSLEKQLEVWEDGKADQVALFAEKKAGQTLEAILEGKFPARPAVRTGVGGNPCAYCPWYAACGYDGRLARNRPAPAGKEALSEIKAAILGQDPGQD